MREIANKAQAQQVFVYIIAIIVFSLIILYGYKAIRTLTSRSEDVSYLKFVNELESAIKQNWGYGDVKIATFNIPGYEKICFVNKEKPPTGNTDICDPNTPQTYEPIMCDAWKAKKQNVFLKPMAKTPIDVWKIKVDNNNDGNIDDAALCIPISSGKLKIKIEGKGDHVVVSQD